MKWIPLAFLIVPIMGQPCLADYVCLGDPNVTVDCTSNPSAWPHQRTGYDTSLPHQCDPPWGPEGPCFNASYWWTVSASNTDPWVNSGGVIPGHLFLWISCSNGGGLGSAPGIYGAEMTLESSLPILSFEPLNGFTNIASGTLLQLLSPGGCVDDWPLLVGRINLDVSDPVSIEGTTEGATWGEVKASYR